MSYTTSQFPIFLYDKGFLPEVGDGVLYHYTKVESFFKILENMTLRLSPFKGLNDLSEGLIDYEEHIPFQLQFEVERMLKEKCRLACFTQNYYCEGFCVSGINHPRMWAQYAENNAGVCIAFDRERLLKKVGDAGEKFFWLEDVKYGTFYRKQATNAATAEEFIRKNYRDLVYLKYIDWENEGEVRLFGIDLPEFIDITDCICFICLGRGFLDKEENMEKLAEMLSDTSYKSYHKFVSHSFCDYLPTIHGYFGMDCSFRILNAFEKGIDNHPEKRKLSSCTVENPIIQPYDS